MNKVGTIKENLLQLISLPGPSGCETPVSDFIMQELQGLDYLVERDGMGNVTATKGGPEDAPLFLLTAHMDEVGLVVTKLRGSFAAVEFVGTINMNICYGLPFRILTETGPIPAVACSPSVHLDQEFKQVWLDPGARWDRVQPGDLVVFDPDPRWLDDGETILAGKAMDDRIGCTILLDLAKRLERAALSVRLVLAFTVQEEISARGAQHVAQRLQPDLAVVVDTALADDPVQGVDQGQPPFGTGPTIRAFEGLRPDRGGFVNFGDRELIKQLKAACDAHNARWQLDSAFNLYTDAAGIRKGSPHTRSVAVGVPRRYSHSPYEVADLKVVALTVDVLQEMFLTHYSQ